MGIRDFFIGDFGFPIDNLFEGVNPKSTIENLKLKNPNSKI